jgi:hypothetical protein
VIVTPPPLSAAECAIVAEKPIAAERAMRSTYAFSGRGGAIPLRITNERKTKMKKQTKVRVASVKAGTLTTDPEIVEIRPINTATVSKYRQNMREGHVFPLIKVTPDGRIVCGNHRWQSIMLEFGGDHLIKVEVVHLHTEADCIELSVKDNIVHGEPLDGISLKRALNKLLALGRTSEEMARLFGRSVGKIKKLAGITVMVTPERNGGAAVPKPVKHGLEHLSGKQVSKEDYDQHIEHDLSGTARQHAEQLARWLENGWVNLQDAKTVAALLALKSLLNKTKLHAIKVA